MGAEMKKNLLFLDNAGRIQKEWNLNNIEMCSLVPNKTSRQIRELWDWKILLQTQFTGCTPLISTGPSDQQNY